MSLASLFSFCSCANAGGEAYSAHIQSFTYHYNGTIGGNSHSFAVQVSDQTARITVEELEHMDYGDVTDTVGMELVQALEELCAKHDVMKFNGFDKTNPHVCDGSGFSLSITYDNGKSVFARGMNSSPKGYRAFSDDLHELFKPYRDKLFAAALQKKIANGVKGDIRFMLMNFIQQGESGFDRYEVMISHAATRENKRSVLSVVNSFRRGSMIIIVLFRTMRLIGRLSPNWSRSTNLCSGWIMRKPPRITTTASGSSLNLFSMNTDKSVLWARSIRQTTMPSARITLPCSAKPLIWQ